MYVAAITFAEHSLHMMNAYYPRPPDGRSLAAAAKRGVDVKIILPGITDSSLAQSQERYQYDGLYSDRGEVIKAAPMPPSCKDAGDRRRLVDGRLHQYGLLELF